jgi:tRNA A-37 threonylcarbamoyl transferase component Bud32
MAEIEEDIEDLECLDLNEMIAEKNKTMKNIDKSQLLSNTISKKDFISTAKYQENPLFKVTRSIESDVSNFLKETEEANQMLSGHFVITGDSIDKTKEKETLTSMLKSTIQKSKQSQQSSEKDMDSQSLLSTLKIDKEREKAQMNQSSSMSYTGSIESNINEGLEIGSYTFDGAVKVSKLLGEGAQAKVYLGVTESDEEDEDSEQLVMAIKHFSFDVGKHKDEIYKEIDSLVHKCQTLKELSHDNIIQYFDCESEYKKETQIFTVNIAMEYQESNLTEFMKNYTKNNKLKTLPINLVAKITKKIVEGLTYLHEHKIIHRDLKPENILMSIDSNAVKIGDFGISVWIKESQNKMKNKIYNYTRDFMKRSVAGTGIYMAPEVLLYTPYGYDCDIWSLGCIVFEMAGGVKPFCTNEPGKIVPTTELQLVKYSNPLEIADENVKDIIYDKKNRTLLDFLQKCWRGNNVYRPTAKELLQHPFIKNVK